MKNITFASFSILWLCRGIVLASISLEIENSAIQHGYSDIDISCVVNGSALRRINRIVMKKSSINIISVSRESIVIDSQFEDQPGVVINASISDVTSAFLQLKILRTTVRFPGDIGLYQCLLFATGISGRFLMFFSRSMFLNITETAAISITSPNRILKYNETDVDVRCIVDPTFINYINNIQLKRSNENVASVSQSYGIYWQDKILENRSGVILNTSINDVTASYLHLKILGSEVKYPEDIGSYECIISAFDFKNGLIIGNSGTLRFEITGFPESTNENNVDRKLFSSAMQTSPVVFSSKETVTISITSPNRILKYNETDVDVRCIVDPTFINYINNIQLKRSNENVVSVSQSYGIHWQDKILENRSGVTLNTSINDVTASYLHLRFKG